MSMIADINRVEPVCTAFIRKNLRQRCLMNNIRFPNPWHRYSSL